MHLIRRLLPILAALGLALPGLASPAAAATCTGSITSPLTFSSLNILSGAATEIQGTLTITCTTTVLDLGSLGAIPTCPSINAGSGGSSGNVRYMAMGARLLQFQILQENGDLWGSSTVAGLGTVPRIDVPVTIPPVVGTGGGSRSVPIRILLLGAQTTAPVGPYSSSFAGAQTSMRYGTLNVANAGGCSALLPLLSQTTATPFEVNATITKNCLVSTESVNFGTQGVLSANVDRQGAVNVTCTGTTAYEVALATGSFTATTRRMTNGSFHVEYGLYQDSARLVPWGTAAAGQTQGGTGNGLMQALPVFGRVKPQPTPPPGTYTDNVAVTVTY